MSRLEVSEIDPLADARWDDYVHTRPDATAYHLSAWTEILARSYRFRPAYRAVVDDEGRLHGVMPMFVKRGPLSGKRVRSMPAVPTGGPLADTPAMATQLLEAACEYSEAADAALVVEGRDGELAGERFAVTRFDRPPAWILALPEIGAESEWLSARSKNLKRSIKKAEKSSLRFREAGSERDLRVFYRLYLETMRGHLSLPRLYRQLRLARAALGPSGVFRLFVVEDGGRIVAGGIFHALGDTVELLYNGSDPDSLKDRPNHLLYREVMRWSRERGYSKLDFGFAWPEMSLGQFKAQWGALPVAEYGYSFLPGGERRIQPAPTGRGDDEQGQESLLAGVWRRAPWAADGWPKVPLDLTRAAALVAYRYL